MFCFAPFLHTNFHTEYITSNYKRWEKTSQQTTKDTKSNYRKVARVQLNLYFIHLLLYYYFFVLPFSVSPQFKTNEIFSAAKIRYCTQWKIHAHNSTCFLVFIVCTLPIWPFYTEKFTKVVRKNKIKRAH